MAAKTVVDVALAHIDAQIADLTRAKALILDAAANGSAPEPNARKPRGPNRNKRGLPAAEGEGL